MIKIKTEALNGLCFFDTKCQKLLTFISFDDMLKMSKEFDILRYMNRWKEIFMFDKGFGALGAGDWFLLAFAAFLLFIFVCDIVMIASMIKAGDERKQIIVYRSSFTTLWITAGRRIIDIV